ncbi:MAG: hypothetical protein FNT15_05225 [Sulfurovum sp.]|nr:MAG: hypothetical protein FNT15_05225 [Sulfurovum sp.]
MYKNDFDQLLKNYLPKSLLMYGDNVVAIEGYIKYYIQKTEAKESLMNLFFEEYDYKSAFNYLSQSSLFGDTNLLIVRSEKELKKNELETLIKLAKNNTTNYFILHLTSTPKSNQLSFKNDNLAVWVRFFEPNISESLASLTNKAKELKIQIQRDTLLHLLKVVENNLALAQNELHKFTIFNEPIDIYHVDRLVYSTAPLGVEELLYELFEKKSIMTKLIRLLESGIDSYTILRATQMFINRITLFQIYHRLHGIVDSKAVLGYKLPKNIEDRNARLVMNLNAQTLLKICEHLLQSELEMKKNISMDSEAQLFGTFIILRGMI